MEMYGMTGERLGTIGQLQPAAAELPGWKKEFLQKPSVSVRKGIAWKADWGRCRFVIHADRTFYEEVVMLTAGYSGYTQPYEDTSTLVLTAPSGFFVDIRFPLSSDGTKPLTSDPSFWAFTGRSCTTFDSDTSDASMPYSAHVVFDHEVDSKGPGINDEGDMFMLPNGDCIEVGIMRNPRSGKDELYKEYWTAPLKMAGSSGGGGRLKLSPCVVAKTVERPSQDGGSVRNGRGAIIRIGDHCQGMLQRQSHDDQYETLVERWLKSPVETKPAIEGVQSAAGEVSNPEWLKDWRSDTSADEQVDVPVPSMWVCAEKRKLGDEILAQGATWRIVEMSI